MGRGRGGQLPAESHKLHIKYALQYTAYSKLIGGQYGLRWVWQKCGRQQHNLFTG